ncbi:ribonuclease H-like domain-containing protein [Tanacetum coccineum]
MSSRSVLKGLGQHSRLGHPTDQVIGQFKQGNLFPLSEHKTSIVGDLIHLDLWGPYKMNSKLSCDSVSELSKQDLIDQLNFFDYFNIQTSKSPYNKGRSTPNDEGSTSNTPKNPRNANPTDDGLNIPTFAVNTENTYEVQPAIATRKSNRQTKLPSKFNNYVVNSSKKYGLEKVVDVINAEIEALNRNNTWFITDLPKGRKPIESKWIFKIKYKASDKIERYKARCLINIDVQKDWPLYQLDVNIAFLYGDLCEDVYLTLPPGFFANNDNVGSGDTFVALQVYVDDIVITGSDIKQIECFKQYLKILYKFGLFAAKLVLSPLLANFVLNHIERNEDKALSNISNQHMHSPLSSHLKIALGVLRYLKGSPGCGDQVNKTGNFGVKVYTDSNWARCVTSVNFEVIYVILEGAFVLIAWSSRA